jgi:hypothetical protein
METLKFKNVQDRLTELLLSPDIFIAQSVNAKDVKGTFLRSSP